MDWDGVVCAIGCLSFSDALARSNATHQWLQAYKSSLNKPVDSSGATPFDVQGDGMVANRTSFDAPLGEQALHDSKSAPDFEENFWG